MLAAWLLLPPVAIGLKTFGYGRMHQVLAPSTTGQLREDLAAASATARLVASAASWSPVRIDCLARSLGLCGLLRHKGLAAEIRIGVSKTGGDFAAHAWVEHGGVALNEPESVVERFLAIDGAVSTLARS